MAVVGWWLHPSQVVTRGRVDMKPLEFHVSSFRWLLSILTFCLETHPVPREPRVS